MHRKIVITDLTRFHSDETVCTAGIDLETGECVRPRPYLTSEFCGTHSLVPGAVLGGSMVSRRDGRPHVEDHNCSNLSVSAPVKSEEFKAALELGWGASVGDGFEFEFGRKEKAIPITVDVPRSLITIGVAKGSVQVVEDGFTPGKLRLHFADESGHEFSFVPLKDLVFRWCATELLNAGRLYEINQWLATSKEVLLRVGLGREHEDHYWLQVNGVYTFPNRHPLIHGWS